MKRLLCVVVVILTLSGCNGGSTSFDRPSRDKPLVATTFYPLTYLVEQLAGDLVDVVCPVPLDSDPLHWRPDPDAIALFQSADLIVFNGASLESWAAQVSLPESRLVNTSQSFESSYVQLDATVHSHGPEGEHSHVGTDPHTWLDPELFKLQMEPLEVALAKLLPEHRQRLSESRSKLGGALEDLSAEFRSVESPPCLLASHPAYNYPAKRYGWNVSSLDFDPEEGLSPSELQALERALENCSASVILWESEPLEAVAKGLRDRFGLQSVVFSPCETLSDADRAAGIDFMSVMKSNLERLKEALRG